MKQAILSLVFLFVLLHSRGQTVTGITANYHDGQIFLTWNNIPNADTGFYYVYKNSVPITASNIQSSSYLGRVRFNFSYDDRLTQCIPGNPPQYLITNDAPFTVLTASQNVFVMNCIKNNKVVYFAVRCDFGFTSPNWTVVPGDNATTVAVTQHLDPIRAYLQTQVIPPTNPDELLDVYLHYGGNVGVGTYPAMANEGCLAFHFGIIKSGVIGGNNSCYGKFHAGGGNFISDAIGITIGDAWKVSFDDWIPAYSFNPSGSNTRWLGYDENVDIYKYNNDSPFPSTGTVRACTFFRNEWELDWISTHWPGTIDPTRIYLFGNSQGCGGVLLHCLVYPEKYASGSVSDPKFNLDAPDDDNPDCKYNEDHSGKTSVRILWGNEDVVNLNTNIPKVPPGSGFYKVFDLTNMNDMYNTQKNKSFPFMVATSGKNDENTCWEEKPPFYKTVQTAQTGGNYYWDLRGHSGSFNAWPQAKVESFSRFSTSKSYPAFSNCGLDGDPGSASNPNPPYFSGDDTGSLHGNIDWLDSTMYDGTDAWEAKLFIFQVELNGGNLFPAVLPASTKSDVSIRRAQNFTGFAQGTHFCWYNIHNGDTIQSGSVTQSFQNGAPKPITVKKVKVFPDGNVLRVTLCDLRQSDLPENTPYLLSVYPNPCSDQFTLDFYASEKSDIEIEIFNLLGERVAAEKMINVDEGKHSFRFHTSSLDAGNYSVKITSGTEQEVLRLMKE